jgi:hypothetical protein
LTDGHRHPILVRKDDATKGNRTSGGHRRTGRPEWGGQDNGRRMLRQEIDIAEFVNADEIAWAYRRSTLKLQR